MLSRKGGNLLQNLLKPDRYLPSGRTIWEGHPEWYGGPEEGVRQQATACQVQLCVSQSSLLEFLGGGTVDLLNGTYSDIDIVDVWGSDTWRATCACAICKAAGNGADQNLIGLFWGFCRELGVSQDLRSLYCLTVDLVPTDLGGGSGRS